MEKKKILVIDDEVNVTSLVKTRLEFHNYYVVPCYTSKRGLEITIREKPDLILMDVMMPDINGYELCKELKANPKTRTVPVILFSAKESDKHKMHEKCMEVGAQDYILKPYEQKELLDKIEKIITKKR
ncbi:MAG: two-component system response regulator [Candidatus Omnitrophica bacterium CG11_big_fil_rev_8_21_14_0_20_42_13]|uniref:Two-component system response regulator n=1 Tax=Candidatus Ghiorseimicrobium undicola TaxID=1974746 RepID=A0A2H0LXN3_9BACT|nr:MAG: two-component system response regulator [Candidatus Omnitrophica bacterium CG11_big_fil_rev_8_21_14_0_20_42_13]